MIDFNEIVLDAAEIEDRTSIGGGPTVARIVVNGKDGKKAFFFVSVGIKRGQPVVTVAKNNSDETSTRKDLRGTWKK